MNEQERNSVADSVAVIAAGLAYLRSKWVIILIAGFLGCCIGVLLAWLEKPTYIAEVTFAPETETGAAVGMYSGLAAQFGIDVAGTGGGVFEGDNLSEFLKSRMLIEKTLLTPVDIDQNKVLLINYYIKTHKIDVGWEKSESLRNFLFSKDYKVGDRARDSVLMKVTAAVNKSLDIQKKDKKLNIISARMMDESELYAKLFIEDLLNNGIEYYVNYRSVKSRQNVDVLQKQADSVKRLLSNSIVSTAATGDLNINPIRQLGRATVQRSQVDIQVNGQLFGELVKQLELAKISLRRETPFIQIIDTPKLPLEKKKLGRLLTGLIAGFLATFICIIYLLGKQWYKQNISVKVQEMAAKI